MAVTKRDLLRHFEDDREIAEAFKITTNAVYGWGLDKPIPAERERQLRDELRPDLFKRGVIK